MLRPLSLHQASAGEGSCRTVLLALTKTGFIAPQKSVQEHAKKGVGVFWYYIDAINLFCPDKPAKTDVLDEVYRRILLFEESLEKADGWLKVPETGMT